MIKTALTVSISSEDIQHFSYLINSTHLGLLSSAAQNIHIQTSHRPIQFMIGIRADEPDDAANLAEQRQKLSHWQAFLPILTHRGSAELNGLLVQYKLQPDLMVCYDENRLQAWIPTEIGFYLLRTGELRRLKPVSLEESFFSAEYHEAHHYYSLQISPDDFYLLLPPDLPTFFTTGEIADLLLGLRQLPAKMSELVHVARQRGYQRETTWLAVEVLRKEEDQHPGQERTRSSFMQAIFGSKKTAAGSIGKNESDSESMADESDEQNDVPKSQFERLLADRRRLIRLVAPLALVLILLISAVIWAIGRPNNTDPTQSTTDPAATEPTITIAATPTPTTRPTASPTPTEPPVILVVSARRLNLRDTPSRDGTLLTTLDNGDQLVQLSEPEDDWVKVRTDDGLTGYVFAQYVTTADAG
ncbi:MAG: SH3 domain-containing protein [Bacillota bacterium]|nr:SH3 domain-containing protein [Bacillota bacterium]